MKERNKRFFDYLLVVLGSLCIIYFILLLMNMSFTKFLLIYPIGAFICYMYAFIELKSGKSNLYRLPTFLRYLFSIIILLGIAAFISAESVIIYQGMQKDSEKSDYTIILGAQINGNKISESLKYRLDG